eukprot:TRINITY_DN2088_c0_g1_i1.p1 TRINITY_DN2088_c0_g1~~TRINITY_DN2088_c0_g1_i1.p1  ORF type:complete len:196 (+),score=70.07 TRINITY_DN2088_c0_g1_i1:407-994(+)
MVGLEIADDFSAWFLSVEFGAHCRSKGHQAKVKKLDDEMKRKAAETGIESRHDQEVKEEQGEQSEQDNNQSLTIENDKNEATGKKVTGVMVVDAAEQEMLSKGEIEAKKDKAQKADQCFSAEQLILGTQEQDENDAMETGQGDESLQKDGKESKVADDTTQDAIVIDDEDDDHEAVGRDEFQRFFFSAFFLHLER